MNLTDSSISLYSIDRVFPSSVAKIEDIAKNRIANEVYFNLVPNTVRFLRNIILDNDKNSISIGEFKALFQKEYLRPVVINNGLGSYEDHDPVMPLIKLSFAFSEADSHAVKLFEKKRSENLYRLTFYMPIHKTVETLSFISLYLTYSSRFIEQKTISHCGMEYIRINKENKNIMDEGVGYYERQESNGNDLLYTVASYGFQSLDDLNNVLQTIKDNAANGDLMFTYDQVTDKEDEHTFLKKTYWGSVADGSYQVDELERRLSEIPFSLKTLQRLSDQKYKSILYCLIRNVDLPTPSDVTD